MKNRYLLVPAFMLAVFLVLAITNPFWRELQFPRFPRWYWILVYSGMTIAISCIAFVVAPAVVKPLTRWCLPVASVAGALLTMLILGLYSYWVGTSLTAQQADALMVRELNHFFRDHRSVVFMFVEVPMFGIIAGLFTYLWNKCAQA
jgi:hypothetical protein